MAFKRGGAQEEEDDAAIGGDDDADNELYAAMERSRRSALAGQAARTGGVDSVVQSVKASAAAAASAGGAKASASGANLDLDFSDTAEFVRNISVEKAHALARGVEAARQTGIVIPGVKEEPAAAAAAAGGNNDGDAEMRNADAGEFIPLGDDEDGGGGGVKKEEGGGAAAAAGPSAEEQEELVSAAEQAIGEEIKASRGLGSVLAMLKQKNQLTEAITWSGRNTDKQPHRVKEKVEVRGGERHPRHLTPIGRATRRPDRRHSGPRLAAADALATDRGAVSESLSSSVALLSTQRRRSRLRRLTTSSSSGSRWTVTTSSGEN